MASSTPPDSESILTVRHLSQVEPQSADRQWLIQNLWLNEGVGILGGAPKLCKTFLAAELSVAVASGGKALAHFEAKVSGPVLFFGAEDSPSALRSRFEGLLSIRQLKSEELSIYLIDVPALHLDDDKDLRRLRRAIELYKPRLLVLDPFVRIAAIDENSAAEVSAVLASLRSLQRDYQLAILVIHHARKSPAAHPTQTLRGSSDFAAWSDTNLCLSRHGKHLALFVEHRSAPAPEPIHFNLVIEPVPHLVLVNSSVDKSPTQPVDPLHESVIRILTASPHPLPTQQIRDTLGRRKTDVIQALEQLKAKGRLQRTAQGWLLAQST